MRAATRAPSNWKAYSSRSAWCPIPNGLPTAGSTLSKHGEIIVDEHGATNLPGIYAAGDNTTVPDKQIVVAMGQGASAGLGAFDYLIRNEPVEEIAQAA